MHTIKLTGIGNSVGVVLPKEILAALNVTKGDQLWLTKTPDGIRLTPYDPEFAAQMEAAKKIMKEQRDVLHELAK